MNKYFSISLLTFLCISNLQSMQRKPHILTLRTTKQDRINVLKKSCQQALRSSHCCKKLSNTLLNALEQHGHYLTETEISQYDSIMQIPNYVQFCYTVLAHNVCDTITKTLPQRHKDEERWKKQSLKNECLHQLKNISLDNFKKLPRDLQRQLIGRYQRIELAYEFAKNNPISFDIAQLIVNQLNGKRAQIISEKQEFDLVFPQSILKHGNRFVLADALLYKE